MQGSKIVASAAAIGPSKNAHTKDNNLGTHGIQIYIYIHQKTNIHGTKALIEKKTGQHHPTSPFLICWALYHPLSRVKSNKKSAPGSSGHCQSRLLQCGAFHLHHRILRELGLADINSLEAHHVFGRGKLRWFLWAQETSELQ